MPRHPHQACATNERQACSTGYLGQCPWSVSASMLLTPGNLWKSCGTLCGPIASYSYTWVSIQPLPAWTLWRQQSCVLVTEKLGLVLHSVKSSCHFTFSLFHSLWVFVLS